MPILENGMSVWPERFPDTEVDAMRRRAGPAKFNSQMMLEPVNIAEGRLDPSLLTRYGGALRMSDELKGLYLEGERLVSASAWWDPAFGRGSGDSSVLAAVFTDRDGVRYLHRVAYLDAPLPDEEDEAARQCRLVAEIVRDLHLPFVAVEINGIGKFLPAILRRELAKANALCAVREMSSTRAKELRILESFDVVLAARLLRVHEDVYKTPFITEMQEWRPGRNSRDDGLDAVAGALSLEPVRLQRLPPASGSPGWRGTARTHQADTDFDPLP